jgi:flagellar biosynthetic protein FlhB
MADESDDSQKTEEPSQKRLDDAHDKGEVAKSNEVRHFFVLMAVTLAIMISGQHVMTGFKEIFRGVLEKSYSYRADGGQLMALSRDVVLDSASLLVMPALILLAGAIAGSMIQHKPVLSFERMAPKLDKISPLKGFKRMFSAQNAVEFLKTLLKFVVVGAVVIFVIWPERERLPDIVSYRLDDVADLMVSLTRRMLMGVVSIVFLIAAADYLFQFFNFRSKMRMSKQELKDEYKQTEGDPYIKGRLRQIRMERSRRRMMAAVPKADVIITNPTHYAIALQYEPTEMAAPVVLAKGVDNIAAKIRELAAEHKIPLVENPPLARALYATVEIDQEVPPEHYRAVAEVISFIMKLRKEKVIWRR